MLLLLLLNGYNTLREKNLLEGLTLANFVVVYFVGKMCVFVSRPMKIVTYLRKKKNGDHPKRVVDFPLERDTFRNTIMEIVKKFNEKRYNNNGKPWKSSKILRVNPNFLIFLSFFIIFLHFSFFSFFIFLHFFNFSFFFTFSFYFIFPSFSFPPSSPFSFSFSFSFSFFFCFSFLLFSFCRGLKFWFILGLNLVTISFHFFFKKKNIFRPVSVVLL